MDCSGRAFIGAPGLVGAKLYLAPTTGNLDIHPEARDAIETLFRQFPGPIVVHSEQLLPRASWPRPTPTAQDHDTLRPISGAVTALRQALALAQQHGGQIHAAHISSDAEVECVVEARAAGVTATCEATLHHLLLDDRYVESHGTYGKVNPPLRASAERAALWARLAAGAIDMVATDHAPHRPDEKDLSYPDASAGLPGVEWMLPLLLDTVARGELTLGQVAELTAQRPAQVFGLERKGRLAPGFDADIALVDTALTRPLEPSNVVSRCGWTPYAGRTIRGWPVMVLVRGRLAYAHGSHREGPRGRPVRARRPASTPE